MGSRVLDALARLGLQQGPLTALAVTATLTGVVVGANVSARGADGAPGGGGNSAPAGPGSLRVTWVGDIVPGRDGVLPPKGGRSLFVNVTDQMRAADLALGNLEGTLTKKGASKCPPGAAALEFCFSFRAPPAHAAALREAGLDAVNLANNHAFDYGASGQGATTAALDKRRIAYTGRPGEIRVVRAGGRRVALVGFATYRWANDLRDLEQTRSVVTEAGRRADTVVVMMHAGAEGSDKIHVPHGPETAFGENRGDSRAFAHAAVDAGADLVLGSGPHVLRGMERYKDRLIAYSLGDFAAWHSLGLGGNLALSGILQVDLAPGGETEAGRFTSLRLVSPGVPTDDRTGAARKLINRVSREDFGLAAVTADRYGVLKLGSKG